MTCALCHSSVDNSFAPGIGRRLDGWANTRSQCGCDRRAVAGAGRCDQGRVQDLGTGQIRSPAPCVRRHQHDSAEQSIDADGHPANLRIEGRGIRDVHADGPISYWNSYVGVGQMGGHGNFSDPRLGSSSRRRPDLVTPKLPALLDYQLSLRAPKRRKEASTGRRGVAASVFSATKPDAPLVISPQTTRTC